MLTLDDFLCNKKLFFTTQNSFLCNKVFDWTLFRMIYHGDVFFLLRSYRNIITCRKKKNFVFIWHMFCFFFCITIFLYLILMLHTGNMLILLVVILAAKKIWFHLLVFTHLFDLQKLSLQLYWKNLKIFKFLKFRFNICKTSMKGCKISEKIQAYSRQHFQK